MITPRSSSNAEGSTDRVIFFMGQMTLVNFELELQTANVVQAHLQLVGSHSIIVQERLKCQLRMIILIMIMMMMLLFSQSFCNCDTVLNDDHLPINFVVNI